jgi:outer membrane protein, heavy metal efflux system
MRAHTQRAAGLRLGRALTAASLALLVGAASAHAQMPDRSAPGASVDELLAMVRKFNLQLAAAALDREAAVAKIGPAGALEDPMVNYTHDQGFRQNMYTVSQAFPLWGKRDLRTGVATATADAARGREGSVARDLEERLKVTFAQYYEASQALDVTRDIRTLLRSVAETARTRYGQGLTTQSDAIRADLAQTRLETSLAELDQLRQTAQAKLNALIGRAADAPLARPGGLRPVPAAASLTLDDLMARARDANPGLAAARAEIAAASGERQLVDKSWYPDLTVTAGVDDLVGVGPKPVVGIGIKVPLQWGVRDAEARAATARRAAAQSRLDSETLNLGSEVKASLAHLHHAEHVRDLLTTSLGPQSDAAYRSALSSYQQGRGDLTSILDAARQRFEIQLDLLRTDTEAEMALAAIERLIGGDL